MLWAYLAHKPKHAFIWKGNECGRRIKEQEWRKGHHFSSFKRQTNKMRVLSQEKWSRSQMHVKPCIKHLEFTFQNIQKELHIHLWILLGVKLYSKNKKKNKHKLFFSIVCFCSYTRRVYINLSRKMCAYILISCTCTKLQSCVFTYLHISIL